MRPRLGFVRVLQSLARPFAALILLGVAGAACKSSSEPNVVVGSVVITPNLATRIPGETVQLSAQAKSPTGADLTGVSFTWSSSNEAAATVDANGLVAAVAPGQATITAEAGGQQGTAAITVGVPVAAFAVSPNADTLGTGKTLALTYTLEDATGAPVTGRVPTWTSSTGSVASVNASGLITAHSVGITTITGTIDGHSDAVIITVLPVCDVRLSPPIAVGQSLQGTLETNDCPFGDGTFLDGFVTSVNSTVDVVIEMTSSAVDAYLFLLKVDADSLALVTEDDDGAGGTDARILATLEAGVEYHIVANSINPGGVGAYTVSLLEASLVAGARDDGVTRAAKAGVKRMRPGAIPLRLPRRQQ